MRHGKTEWNKKKKVQGRTDIPLCREGIEMAEKIYIEPLTLDVVKKIIKIEKPDSILSTLGGQTGLTLSLIHIWLSLLTGRYCLCVKTTERGRCRADGAM